MALLTRLLLLDPGTIQSHPDMGVGLMTRYRYRLDTSAIELQSDFRQQIDKWLPKFQGTQVRVKMEDHSFLIYAVLDNYLFSFIYDIEESTLTNKFTALADL